MAYNPQTINSGDPITSTWGNKIEQELATVGNYLGRVASKGLLNNLSADYKDFAWVDDEQAFYWYAGNGWFPYDVKRLKEGFTLVNLLGSYGSFDKDSDGDGLADGWAARTDTTNLSVSNGVQAFSSASTDTVQSRIQIPMNVIPPLHDYFIQGYVRSSGGIVKVSQDGAWYFFTTDSTNFVKFYIKKTFVMNVNIYYFFFNTDIGTTGYVKQVAFYDLTWMDQYSPMPQSLQEKYSVSKWVDMTDDDLAAELPYVDGVAYVGAGL